MVIKPHCRSTHHSLWGLMTMNAGPPPDGLIQGYSLIFFFLSFFETSFWVEIFNI
jgi:hypothetical protein